MRNSITHANEEHSVSRQRMAARFKPNTYDAPLKPDAKARAREKARRSPVRFDDGPSYEREQHGANRLPPPSPSFGSLGLGRQQDAFRRQEVSKLAYQAPAESLANRSVQLNLPQTAQGRPSPEGRRDGPFELRDLHSSGVHDMSEFQLKTSQYQPSPRYQESTDYSDIDGGTTARTSQLRLRPGETQEQARARVGREKEIRRIEKLLLLSFPR